MAKRIPVKDVLKPNPKYPISIIIIDTNIVINYVDPFGYVNEKLNAKTVEYLNQLKSNYKVNSTSVTALEYFNYLKHGYYNIFIETHPGNYEKFSKFEFKKIQRRNPGFSAGWDIRLKAFKKTFKKYFPPFNFSVDNIYTTDLLEKFDGTKTDFGDELIYQYSQQLDFPVIISMDRDFDSYPDDLNLIVF